MRFPFSMRVRKTKKRQRKITRAGVSIFVILVLVLFAAWNTGTNLLYVVFGGLASFILISHFMSSRMLRGLDVSREAPRAIHREDTCPISIRVENRKRFLPTLALRVERGDAPGQTRAFAMQIPARRAAVMRVNEVFPRRGVHPLPAMNLVTSFPFGLVDMRLRIQDHEEIVVYPKVRSVRLGRIEHNSGGGNVPRDTPSEGDEFHALREYVPGDDPRKIAWKQSAKLGQMLVKELEQETARFVVFAFNTRVLEYGEESETFFEEAVELVASLAASLCGRNYLVSVQTPDGYVEPGDGRAHVLRILEFLARVKPLDESGASDFSFAHEHEMPRCTYVYVSADPSQWGVATSRGGTKVLHPKDVIHA